MSGASFANALSVLDTAHLGALEAQLGASNYGFLGSSVSLRGVTWLVSSLALTECARVGSSKSGRGCSVARCVTFRETFHSSCLFATSVFTHIVRILLRTIAFGQAQGCCVVATLGWLSRCGALVA